jgi:hypothetical protein
MKVEIRWYSVGEEGVITVPVVARSWSHLARVVASYIPWAVLTDGGWIESFGERIGAVRDLAGRLVCAPGFE